MQSNNISTTASYRLGLKNLMDLYPSRVRDKIVADSKLKNWDEINKKVIADVAREISDFEGKNPSEFCAISTPLIALTFHLRCRSDHCQLQG